MYRRAFLAAAPVSLLAGCTGGRGADGPNSNSDSGSGDDDSDGGDSDPTPELVDASLTVLDVASEVTGQGAEVSFDAADGTVTVAGTVVGSDGCKTAALDGASYDQGADELTVAVATEDRTDAGTACTQALVYVEYEVTATFAGGLPAAVTVTHDGEAAASVER